MRARYTKYFLNHVLLLKDELATYCVQNNTGIDDPTPGIALKTFFDHRQAADWLRDCIGYDDNAIRNLRDFLSENSTFNHALYEMDDHQVIDEAAAQFIQNQHPIVIMPVHEPPELQSELIDIICAVQDGTYSTETAPEQKSSYFQIGHVRKFHYDNNIALNILKLIPNSVSEIWNAGVDTVNTIMTDAQYLKEKGLAQWFRARLNTEVNWAKSTAKALNDLVQYGPRQVMNTITTLDMDGVKGFFGSALYAKNWEAAVSTALAIFVTRKPTSANMGSAGAGAIRSAPRKKIRQKQHIEPDNEPKTAASNELEAVDIKTAKQESAELEHRLGESRTVPKTPPKPAKTPDELYEDIRNSKTDVADIAKHNNLKPERIQKIKDYVFKNPKFESDSDTANAWMRMAEGKGTAHDKFLLKHETTELFYKDWIEKNPEKYMKKYDPLDAHEITTEAGFDWEGGLTKRGPRNKDL